MTAVETQSLDLLATVEPKAADYLASAITPAELGEVLELLCEGGTLARVLDRLLDRDDLAELAAESYEHPNGFDKVVLARFPSGQKLVIHVWPGAEPGEVRRDGNLHNHRWHFATRVLAGSYNFTEFEPGSATDTRLPLFCEHSYAIRPDGGHGLRQVGSCRLAPARSRRLRAGDVYLLSSSVIHGIEMDAQEPTVTLFLQGPAVSSETRVFSEAPLAEDGQVNVPRMGRQEYRQRLLALRAFVS